MIVLSVGMPRAGSGWHYNLIHDLMAAAGAEDARTIREKYRLHSILTEVNCNIGVLSFRRLAMVTIPALMGNTFVIKAHAGPTLWSRMLTSIGLLRCTYIYRDPRDAMLSAHEYGQRALSRGRPNAFSHLLNFESSLEFMQGYVGIWSRWRLEKGILVARYEDLLGQYDTEITRLVAFLRLKKDDAAIGEVIERYRPGQAHSQQGLHFFKGKVGRFRDFYSAAEQAILVEKFAQQLQQMGYTI